MGLNASKTPPEGTREIQTYEDNNAPTPTPQSPAEGVVIADFDLDPRSPSVGIIRTPIQFLKRTSEAQDTPTAATTDKSEAPQTFIFEDPRSPSTEFSRTPITFKAIEGTNGMKIHNKNLDKALRSFYPSPNIKYPVNIEKRRDISEAAVQESEANKAVTIIPPKLLESSPISTKSTKEVNKRRSFVGLLETNIDFTETDLDVVVALKRKSVAQAETTEDNVNGDTGSGNSSNGALLQLAEKIENVTLEEETSEALIDDNDDPIIDFMDSVEIIKDPPSINEIDDAAINSLPGMEIESRADICETKYQSRPNFNSLPRSVQKIKIDESGDNYSPITSPRVFEIMVDVNNFDKKLTDLIYEDDDVAYITKTSKPKDNDRTPLANKNSSSEPKRTAKLKVSDKPRRSHVVGPSRIPVSKTKTGKKILTQCENTPPRSKQLGNKKAQWDTEKTLII